MIQSLSLIHKDWLAIAFEMSPENPALAMLKNNARIQNRVLERVLADQNVMMNEAAIDPKDIGGIDAKLVSAPAETLLRTARWAGAAWHGQDLRGVLLSDDIARLVAELGDDVFEHARRNAISRAPDDRSSSKDTATFTDRTRREAETCLAAWAASLPRPLSVLIRLRFPKFPNHAIPDGTKALAPPLQPSETRAEAFRLAARSVMAIDEAASPLSEAIP